MVHNRTTIPALAVKKQFIMTQLIRLFFLSACLASLAMQACGQYYNQRPEFLKANQNWAFGDSAGMDFSNGTPVTTLTSMYTIEGCASVSDTASGDLLFYAGGSRCYNRNHEVMPNGDTLNDGGGTTSQGDCIVPVIDSPGKFYLFSLNYQSSKPALYYSVIDMSLDNGLGDVVAGRKNILLDTTSLSEAMIAVPGDNCDVWLITHTFEEPVFKVWHITRFGLDPVPVTSVTGSQINGSNAYLLGGMAIAPNRKMIAMSSASGLPLIPAGPQACGLLLCRFDPATGIVSDASALSNTSNYGACFSPDNTKLYAGSGYLNQYDVSAFLPGGTVPPPVFVANGVLAPRLYKDTIYCPTSGSAGNSVSRINKPDLSGTACNVQTAFLYLQPGSILGLCFPNEVIYPLPPDTTGGIILDTLVCAGNTTGLDIRIAAAPGYRGYLWNDGSTDSARNITERGVYWVLCKEECHSRIDTFIIGGADVQLNLGPDTTICNRSAISLNATVAGADRYEWSDGSTGPLLEASADGLYRVSVYKGGCIYSDSVRLKFIDVKQYLGPDLLVCRGDPIRLQLSARVPNGGDILWSTGSTDISMSVVDTGKYWLRVSQPPCMGSDTLRVGWKLCDCFIRIPTAFSPNGDGLNDVFLPVVESGCTVNGYQLQIFNRWGQLVFQSPFATGNTAGWDGKLNGQPAESGTYMYRLWLEAGTERHIQEKRGNMVLIR